MHTHVCRLAPEELLHWQREVLCTGLACVIVEATLKHKNIKIMMGKAFA
jgi:hypothetical protein